jgi:RNA polymerase sigma-70 factor (ECF subfamily)
MAGMPRTAPEDRGGSTSRDGRPDPATEAFLAHRNLLFTVAYELLGSAADAEDVLQETWLRWAGVDLGAVRDQRAYLVRVTARQALTRLRTLGRRRESYVGPWLPEPLLTAPDVAEDVELAESVSMALLLVLETVPLGLAGAGPGWPAARTVLGCLVARHGPVRSSGLGAGWLPGASWGGGLPWCGRGRR